MRRVVLKSPVLENCTPGSVRGAPGNRRPYLAIMQREEKPEPMRMILSGHDSVLRSSCGPADFLAACEQFKLLQCRENSYQR
jgi:hypothetical protein